MPSDTGPLWRYAAEPSSEKAVKHVERVLGVTFPADYRACVKENGGGAPEPAGFTIDLGGPAPEPRSVGLLITLDPQDSENLLDTVNDLDLAGKRPEGLIPIINDGEGNYVCLDYRDDRSASSPTVSYLIRESGQVVPLAPTFARFLQSLA